MRIETTLLTMRSEFRGLEQVVEMVQVRDLDRPELTGLSALAPEDSFAATQMTRQELFDVALIRALAKLKDKDA